MSGSQLKLSLSRYLLCLGDRQRDSSKNVAIREGSEPLPTSARRPSSSTPSSPMSEKVPRGSLIGSSRWRRGSNSRDNLKKHADSSRNHDEPKQQRQQVPLTTHIIVFYLNYFVLLKYKRIKILCND